MPAGIRALRAGKMSAARYPAQRWSRPRGLRPYRPRPRVHGRWAWVKGTRRYASHPVLALRVATAPTHVRVLCVRSKAWILKRDTTASSLRQHPARPTWGGPCRARRVGGLQMGRAGALRLELEPLCPITSSLGALIPRPPSRRSPPAAGRQGVRPVSLPPAVIAIRQSGAGGREGLGRPLQRCRRVPQRRPHRPAEMPTARLYAQTGVAAPGRGLPARHPGRDGRPIYDGRWPRPRYLGRKLTDAIGPFLAVSPAAGDAVWPRPGYGPHAATPARYRWPITGPAARLARRSPSIRLLVWDRLARPAPPATALSVDAALRRSACGPLRCAIRWGDPSTPGGCAGSQPRWIAIRHSGALR